jgi:ssDNA-binding Zn-finger/Zn-ribbon topoisomerase 1
MGKFNPDLLPQAFKRCPLCHAEGSLSITSLKSGLKSEKYLSCTACDSKWGELTEHGMRLFIGPNEHLGFKSLAEWAALSQSPIDLSILEKKVIKETKCTCNACGHVWFYGKQETREATSAVLGNLSKSMMCCSGCLPAIFIPDKKIIDLNKCPKCGSRAVTRETVSHEV